MKWVTSVINVLLVITRWFIILDIQEYLPMNIHRKQRTLEIQKQLSHAQICENIDQYLEAVLEVKYSIYITTRANIS